MMKKWILGIVLCVPTWAFPVDHGTRAVMARVFRGLTTTFETHMTPVVSSAGKVELRAQSSRKLPTLRIQDYGEPTASLFFQRGPMRIHLGPSSHWERGLDVLRAQSGQLPHMPLVVEVNGTPIAEIPMHVPGLEHYPYVGSRELTPQDARYLTRLLQADYAAVREFYLAQVIAFYEQRRSDLE